MPNSPSHSLLTMRISNEKVYTHGDRLDLLLCLNQDTMDRHLSLMGEGTVVIYNGDNVTPAPVDSGAQFCSLPVAKLTNKVQGGASQNMVALGTTVYLVGLPLAVLEQSIAQQFSRKSEAIAEQSVSVARAGYEHAAANFTAFPVPLPENRLPLGIWTGNEALAINGATAGVKFYAAYPMSPATGVLHWMAAHARDLGIMVRQAEDEIAVANGVMLFTRACFFRRRNARRSSS